MSNNLVKISDHVNTTLKEFQSSEKPQWAAPLKVMNANRYSVSWHSYQRILAHMEQVCKKAQEIPDKDSLRDQF
jgi:hypothetical protein